MGVLVSPDGSITLPCLLLLVGIPLVAMGHYHSARDETTTATEHSFFDRPIQSIIGGTFVTLGLALAVVAALLGGGPAEKPGRREDLKYELMPSREILDELRAIFMTEQAVKGTRGMKNAVDPDELTSGNVKTSVRCLTALAIKCGREQGLQKRRKDNDTDERWADRLAHKPHELELLCQEASYIVLKSYPSHDVAVSSAVSLLALVAGDSEVRKRNVEAADRFGLDVPVRAMKDALGRAKDCGSPSEEEERVSAELQRKGCLLLGALSDSDKNIATKVVDEDGLVAILDAIDWYRYHEEVATWGLWAIFCLCYDHLGNKGELVKLDGIRRICRAMKDVPESIEVARHGVAILFDMLREVPGTLAGVTEMRTVAVGARMQDVVKRAMEEFPQSEEIMMMGQQMLVATGYKGDIPHYAKASFAR